MKINTIILLVCVTFFVPKIVAQGHSNSWLRTTLSIPVTEKIKTDNLKGSGQTNEKINIISNELIKVLNFEIALDKLFEPFEGNEYNKGILKEFIEFDFQKLEVYKDFND